MPQRRQPKPFDFAADDPQRLLAECQPEDLYRAVKALERWNARAVGVTESALAYWTSSAIARPRDREGVGEIRSLIRRLQSIQPLERQDADLDIAARYQHWNGMVTVLESRAHLMDYHVPEDVERRTHMAELRAALQANAASEGLRTQDLLATLGVSAPRLSQLLTLAEAAGLIERQKKGREQWVAAAGIWRRGDRIDEAAATLAAMAAAEAVAAAAEAAGSHGMHVPGKAKLAA